MTIQDEQERNEGVELEESFADLLGEEPVRVGKLKPGQQVVAKVVGITGESVFLDLGVKSEGYIPRREFEEPDGTMRVEVGDTVKAYFLSEAHNELLFTTVLAGGSASRAHLEEAWRNAIPVEGLVEKEVKGGLSVRLAGNVRAFCPYSQTDIRRSSDPAGLVGERLSFRITEIGEGGKNIVVSRRVLLEEEREQKKAALRETLREGMRVRGTVSSIRPFGAFVDVGGVEGLIPLSEMAWGRVEDPAEILREGQEVEVVVSKLDWQNERLSFSLKEALADPWDTVEERYSEGTWKAGVVSRLTAFGAFVTLEPGVDGLLHISELGQGRRLNHPREAVQEGQEVEVRIAAVDKASRRISLSLSEDKAVSEQKERRELQQVMASMKKGAGSGMGSLGELLKKKIDKKKK